MSLCGLRFSRSSEEFIVPILGSRLGSTLCAIALLPCFFGIGEVLTLVAAGSVFVILWYCRFSLCETSGSLLAFSLIDTCLRLRLWSLCSVWFNLNSRPDLFINSWRGDERDVCLRVGLESWPFPTLLLSVSRSCLPTVFGLRISSLKVLESQKANLLQSCFNRNRNHSQNLWKILCLSSAAVTKPRKFSLWPYCDLHCR